MRWCQTLLMGFFSYSILSLAHGTILHTEIPHQAWEKTWSRLRKSEGESLSFLLQLLKGSSAAQKLILLARERAQKVEESSLEQLISAGPTSLTDTTLIRRFSPDNPLEVEYALKSRIVLNRDLPLKHALLDLVHELTHFVFRQPFNPYRSEFRPSDFVKNTIEGRGGELDALLMECRVMRDLFPPQAGPNAFCRSSSYQEGRESGRELFYRVGAHFPKVQKMFKKLQLSPHQLPEINSQQAVFISSAYGVPYPLAALQEYVSIMQKACLNDQRRLQGPAVGRAPAAARQSVQASFMHRCRQFL